MTVPTIDERHGATMAMARFTPEQRSLWERIEAFPLDEAESRYPFTAKLGRENGWTPRFARRAVEEYRKFVFLAASAGHPVCPSEEVDQVWHLHLTYTQSYWHAFCRDTLGRPLHHNPSKGGNSEQSKHVEMYERTLESYGRFFGEPSRDLWPAASKRFGEDTRHRQINDHEHWVIRKRPVKIAAVGAGALALLVPALGFAQDGPDLLNPFDLRGPAFLLFFFGAALAGLALAAFFRRALRPPGDEPPRHLPPLHPYEVAYLTGGEMRAVNTALASLADRGHIEPLPPERAVRWHGELPDSPETHPLDLAVRKHIPRFRRPLMDLRPDLKSTVEGMADRLRSLGLIVDPSVAARARFVPLSIALIAPALGVIKIAVGISRGRPVAFLVIGCVVATLLALVFFARPVRRSRRGDHLLRNLRKSNAGLRFRKVPAGSATGDLSLAMALFGVAALSGSAHAQLRKALNPPYGSSGCGGGCTTGSGGDSGGSGCGGGGDGGGGGGCGGCGGGGD